MNLQLLRGRDLRPPSRRDSVRPVAVPGFAQPQRAQQQNGRTQKEEGSVRKKALSFPVAPSTRAFYRRFYPETSTAEWNDWRWQMRTRIRTLAELERVFALSDDERRAVAGHTGPLPVGITPYYASLMGLDDPVRAAAPHPRHGGGRIPAPAGRIRGPAGRGPRHRRPRHRPSLPRPGPVPQHRDVFDLLPLLHARARGGQSGGRVPAIGQAMGPGARPISPSTARSAMS